jgi:electron transfer flavoprotein alpha subunit
MSTLLLAEHDNAVLKDPTAKALTAAKALGADVHILVAGRGCAPVADAAAKLDGVAKVLLCDAPAYEHFLAEPTAALIVALSGGYESLLAAATTTGKNIMPRVAALLDVMQISDVSRFTPAMPSRPSSRMIKSGSSRCAPLRSRQPEPAARHRLRPCRRPMIPIFLASSARSYRSPIARS